MGKIFDALTDKNRPAPTKPTDDAQIETTEQPVDFTKFKPLAYGMAVALFVGVVAFASWSVFDLFANRLSATTFEAALAVVASVGVTVVTLFVVLTTRHAPVRGIGAIVLIAWTLIVLVLVGLNSALRGGLLNVPDGISNVGQVAAALLAALALIPVIVIPLAMNDRSHYESAAGAASKYIGFMAKGAGIGASAIASAYFGISRGINPLLAVFCGIVLESCFLWAYLKLIHAKEDEDLFDVVMWSVSVALFGVFIALVSIETLSTLGGIKVPIVSAFGEVGASLYVSAVGLSVFLTIITHILTSMIDIKDANKNGVIERNEVTIGRRPAVQMAGDGDKAPMLEAADDEPVPARKIGEGVGGTKGTTSGQSSPDVSKSGGNG